MGLGTWRSEEIEIVTPSGEISMKDAVAQYGNPYFDVDRRVVRSGMMERSCESLEYFSEVSLILSRSVVSGVGLCE